MIHTTLGGFQMSEMNQDVEQVLFHSQQIIIHQIQKQAIANIITQAQNKERILQNENSKLKDENVKLAEKINLFEIKQEELVNEIQDLRLLVKRVYTEGEIHSEKLREKNLELTQENDTLLKALKSLQNNIETFSNLKQAGSLYDDLPIDY